MISLESSEALLSLPVFERACWQFGATPVLGPVSWCLGDGTEQLRMLPQEFLLPDAVRELLSSRIRRDSPLLHRLTLSISGLAEGGWKPSL